MRSEESDEILHVDDRNYKNCKLFSSEIYTNRLVTESTCSNGLKLIVPKILFFSNNNVILNIIIFCAAYVVFCLFLGGPIKGVCVEASTALKTSAMRWVWSLMSVFQPFDSMTSVARL